MTDALTQLRDALQTVITTSEHALVPRALLRELLARLEAAEAVVDAATRLMDANSIQCSTAFNKAWDDIDTALSTHAKMKDATHD